MQRKPVDNFIHRCVIDVYRRRQDAVVAMAAAVVLVITTLMTMNGTLYQWEIDVFRFVNDWPDFLFPVIWPFMQYGGFLTIPIATLIALYANRKRLALMLFGGGVGIFYMAILIKNFVERGRPEAFLDNINAHEIVSEGSFGFTSGHAAVAATIATYTLVYLPRRWRIASSFESEPRS